MAQRLIVEGKDAIVLSNILMKRNLQPPKDYEVPLKYKNEFVKEAGSISKVETVLVEELQSTDVTHIGIIVDANNVGASARLDSIKSIIEKTLDEKLPSEIILNSSGITFQILNLSIGIWIMPDNQNQGYLEHFVCGLIPEENPVWKFTNEKVDELMSSTFCEFAEVKKQKALLHTYLAWKKSPGLPMGTAVEANYLNAASTSAGAFVSWFQQTFDFED
ncbi:MAG: DUF3226 domain-containing protein [Saprospiraceae bacterium]